jgi:carbamoyltransferase
MDVIDENFVLAAMDPVAIDRLAMDGLDLEHHHYGPIDRLVRQKIPYARHESVQLYGDVDMARLEPTERVDPPRNRVPGKKLVILGVASTTLQNHGAVLLMDGEVVAAVQEERIRRRKQQGWHPPGKPRDTVVSNPRIPLERSYPVRSIQCVLDMAGITLDDVDYIAHNGVPQQFFHTYDLLDPTDPPHTVRDGRNIFIPHHLAHAASGYRVSGMEDAFVFTVDGSGERETAAFFEVRDGRLHRTFDVLCVEDSLIGGVYEFFTTILGFGHHGQGSTMGLACMGKNSIDLSHYLSAKDRSDYSIHDRDIMKDWGHLARARDGVLLPEHKDLAASLQKALEDTIIRFIEDGLDGRKCPRLVLAGGVALNCRMNQVLRQRFGVEEIFVQPAAHDAGTALGAALEAHFEITGEPLPYKMDHAYLGPAFTNEQIEEVLISFGLPYRRSDNISEEVADMLVEQNVVCWFQGGLEFGPRALGARSIVADPRSEIIKDRINTMKGRQWWRPLGPSILSGHEDQWFEHPLHSPFMLFTLPVLTDKQGEIPAVLHFDGTTRPQSVTAEASPRYHAMIERFFEKTGVPMVINTSFNTGFEPIVQSPEDAISSFLQLGADALAIGDWIVLRQEEQQRAQVEVA